VAFGNVIGSNILNILCILGVAALIRPSDVQGLRQLDMGVLIGIAVLILPLMWRGSVLKSLGRRGAVNRLLYLSVFVGSISLCLSVVLPNSAGVTKAAGWRN